MELREGMKIMEEKSHYKKTYKPFVIWFILMMAGSMVVPVLLEGLGLSEKALVKVLLILTIAALDILMYIIYHGEYVYWINGGPRYEEAAKAESARRKAYAGAHLRIFLMMTGMCILYMLISWLAHFGVWLDILVITLAIFIAAVRTMPIKF